MSDLVGKRRPRQVPQQAAQVTLPVLEIAPPVIFWAKAEIAIVAFHHAVCAAATGLAYQLIDATR
jgi:hypothetical protein